MKECIKILLLFLSVQALGQDDCGTVVTQENLDFLERAESSLRISATSSNAVVNIPVKFHALKTTSGEGGMTTQTKDQLIARLNGFFQNSNMMFSHVGEVNEIIDDDNYNFNSNNEGAVAATNDVSRTVNIYFFGSIIGLCGYTRFPPSSDRIFVANGCISGGTLEHEVGHYFTLFHTHGKTNTGTTDELVNGSNCLNGGDNVCDTEADPNLSGVVNGSCAYTGSATDANGQLFTPDPRNIMSYAPGNCRDRFSSGQYSRVRQGFEIGRAYLNWTSDSFTANFVADQTESCKGVEIQFDGTSFGATKYNWSFPGGSPSTSTQEDPKILYSNGGVFDVTLTVTDNGGNEVIARRRNYIEIVDPLLEAREFAVKADFNDGLFPEEYSVVNPDFGYTFEVAEVDVDGDGMALILNNFDYKSELKGNRDIIETGIFSAVGVKKYLLSFDYAYTYINSHFADGSFVGERTDSLIVRIPKLCGVDEQELWRVGGDDLRTVPPKTIAFVPSNSDWKYKEFEILVGEDLEYLSFELENRSYNGNNLYIDNLNVVPDYSVDAPTNLRISKITSDEITIRWDDKSVNELSFVLERTDNSGDFELIANLAKNTIFYRDTDFTPGQRYSYRIKAIGVNDNESFYSQVVTMNILNSESPRDNGLVVYPNPSNGSISISFQIAEGEAYYKVYNISGEIVMAWVSDLTYQSIDVEQLRSGLYFLEVSTSHGDYSERIVITR